MATPEELLEKLERARARGEELKTQIVRAERWDQLFATPEEAITDFLEHLVNAHRFYYGKDDARTEYHVEQNPRGNIHVITRDPGYATTYQRLPNGDVVLVFHYPDKPTSVNHITPSVGNIDHVFTPSDVADIPTEERVLEIINNRVLYREISSAIGRDFTLFSSHLRGKPATEGWEDTILHNGYLPQRVGYCLFPDYALEAFVKFKATSPHLLSQN